MLYLLATTGSIGFAGLGTGEFGLGNPDVQRNAFLALAAPVLGSFALLISVAVLSSSAASLQSTMVSPSRTLLAMGHYGALPDFLTRLSPRFRTPSAAILTSTLVSRSEEHTSELQSLMRISYAVFCLKKKNKETII